MASGLYPYCPWADERAGEGAILVHASSAHQTAPTGSVQAGSMPEPL